MEAMDVLNDFNYDYVDDNNDHDDDTLGFLVICIEISKLVRVRCRSAPIVLL